MRASGSSCDVSDSRSRACGQAARTSGILSVGGPTARGGRPGRWPRRRRVGPPDIGERRSRMSKRWSETASRRAARLAASGRRLALGVVGAGRRRGGDPVENASSEGACWRWPHGGV